MFIFLFDFFILFYFIFIEKNENYLLLESKYKILIILTLSWILIANFTKLYIINRQIGFSEIIRRLIIQIFIFSIVFFSVSGINHHNLFININSLKLFFYLLLYCLFIRFCIILILKFYRKQGKNIKNIIFIDFNKNTILLKEILLKRKDYGYKIINLPSNNLNNLELENFLISNKIKKLFFSLDGNLSTYFFNDINEICTKHHIEINFISSDINDDINFLKLDYYETFPVLNYKNFPLDLYKNRILKRIFDILFSLMILSLFSWLFIIFIIIIYLDSGKPIFFIQKRIGYKNKIFDCIKFRTMIINPLSDKVPTIKNDSRITKFGKFLRKISLDELPQFFNVLKGEMSVIGPRPHMISQNEYYSDIIKKYNLRHFVKPGITGLAQIKGFRGEINSPLDMQKRINSDVYYIKNWSFMLDFVIIFKTIIKIISDKNAI